MTQDVITTATDTHAPNWASVAEAMPEGAFAIIEPPGEAPQILASSEAGTEKARDYLNPSVRLRDTTRNYAPEVAAALDAGNATLAAELLLARWDAQ